ncbi:MAG TPA: hypothetical protein PK397_09260 [Ignavibacteriaceae bacterium]|nr:hypothetical protein [Ignavibacteriaceae bacterium]
MRPKGQAKKGINGLSSKGILFISAFIVIDSFAILTEKCITFSKWFE